MRQRCGFAACKCSAGVGEGGALVIHGSDVRKCGTLRIRPQRFIWQCGQGRWRWQRRTRRHLRPLHCVAKGGEYWRQICWRKRQIFWVQQARLPNFADQQALGAQGSDFGLFFRRSDRFADDMAAALIVRLQRLGQCGQHGCSGATTLQ